MKIYIHELSEEHTLLDYSEKDKWVTDTVGLAQETPIQGLPPKYKVHFDLHKSENLIFLKGKVQLFLGALCSRCATNIILPIKSSYEAIFTQEKQMAGDTNFSSHGVAHSKPTGKTGVDVDISYLEKDYIELEDVLKEQIYLTLPVQPLCKEDCKGICAVCGQDQNVELCQCYRLKNTALANALKGFNKKLKN